MSYILAGRPSRHRVRVGVPGGQLEQAQALYRQFHTFPCGKVVRTCLPRAIPEVLVHLGQLRGVIYSSDRGNRRRSRTFIHFMEDPPLLTCNPTGTQLYILGGHYRVTKRGIEG